MELTDGVALTAALIAFLVICLLIDLTCGDTVEDWLFRLANRIDCWRHPSEWRRYLPRSRSPCCSAPSTEPAYVDGGYR